MRKPSRIRSRARLPLAAAILAVLSFPASAAILVQVDKSAQRMTVSQDGRVLYDWPVSTGKRGYATPGGDFRAFRLEENHFSKEFDDAPMPHSIFFTRQGHAIHGSYDKRIGAAVSHGCIRLSPRNAETLYRMVSADGVLNTRVVVTGSEPVSAPDTPVSRRRVPPPPEEYAAGGQDARGFYGAPQYQPPQYGQRYPQYAPPANDSYSRRYSYDESPYYRAPPRGFVRPYYQPYQQPYAVQPPGYYERRGY